MIATGCAILGLCACVTGPEVDQSVPAEITEMCPDTDPVPCPAHQECRWNEELQCTECHCIDTWDPMEDTGDDAGPLPAP